MSMSSIDLLIRDLNCGGIITVTSKDERVELDLIRADGVPGPDVYMLKEAGADVIFLTLENRAYFKILKRLRLKDIIHDLARKESGCPGVLKNGWWKRRLDQITGLTFHHTLSDSPHATAKNYIRKDGGRPSIPYTIWITQTGEVLLCNPLTDGCWHDHTGHKNRNLSVGLAGTLHKYRPALVQLQAAVQVVKWAVNHIEMKITIDTVKGHMDVGTCKGRTECPGWNSKASGYWKDDFYKMITKALQ